jgi:membrane-bound ClpP family serine protease
MEIVGIVALIVFGIILLLVEFFVVAGTIIPGAIGIALMVAGVMLSYSTFGNETGNYTLLATMLFVILAVYKLLKSKTWDKVALHAESNSKVNTIDEKLAIGNQGITISRLAPMGKVMINGQVLEARAESEFINPKEKIIVVAVEQNRVLVTRSSESKI